MPLVHSTARNREARARGEAALLAAVEELVAGGTPYSELGIGQIAKAAGFSRATFYAYFTDKRDLALRLGARVQDALDEQIGPWLETGDGDLRDVIAAGLAVFTETRAATKTLVEAASYDPEIAALWRGMHARFEAGARTRIRAALPDLPDADVAARAFALIWGTQAAMVEFVDTPRGETGPLLDALLLQWETCLSAAG